MGTEQVEIELEPGLARATRWRVFAPNKTRNAIWDIKQKLEFMNSTGILSLRDCVFLDSAHYEDKVSFAPQNLRDGTGMGWGGRRGENGEFFVGVEFPCATIVSAVKLHQGGHFEKWAETVQLEAEIDGRWTTLATVSDCQPEQPCTLGQPPDLEAIERRKQASAAAIRHQHRSLLHVRKSTSLDLSNIWTHCIADDTIVHSWIPQKYHTTNTPDSVVCETASGICLVGFISGDDQGQELKIISMNTTNGSVESDVCAVPHSFPVDMISTPEGMPEGFFLLHKNDDNDDKASQTDPNRLSLTCYTIDGSKQWSVNLFNNGNDLLE